MAVADDFFGLPQELTPEQYIEIANEVVEIASLVFAPLGAARSFGKFHSCGSSLGDPLNLKEEFEEIWQRTMDSVAEAVYRKHGLSEGTVALSCHKLLEGSERNQLCIDAVSKTQQALSKMTNPPRFLDLSGIDDPDINEIKEISLKILESIKTLSGSSSMSSMSNSRQSSNSAGWSGTYIGTVFALGFKMNDENQTNTQSKNECQNINNVNIHHNVQDNIVNPPNFAIDTLLGQKLKMSQTCNALNEVRETMLVKRIGGSLNSEMLQAYAEIIWDKHQNMKNDIIESKEANENKNVDKNIEEVNHDQNYDIIEEGLQCFSDVSASSIAWKSLSFTNSKSWSNHHHQQNSSSSHDQELKDAKQRADALSHVRKTNEKLALAKKFGPGDQSIRACNDALAEAHLAVNAAWGSVLPLERIASILCSRAQIFILISDNEMQQAMVKRESSFNSWYGGAAAMEAVTLHEQKSQEFEAKAHQDVAWAKSLCPNANAVRRWNAELELRSALEAIEVLENPELQQQVQLHDLVALQQTGQFQLCENAKLAVTELCRAFVNDGSRDAALAQALEEGARASTKYQARKCFREQMYLNRQTEEEEEELIYDDREEYTITKLTSDIEQVNFNNNVDIKTKKKEPVNNSSSLPASWLIESFMSGFFIPSKLFTKEMSAPPPSFLMKYKKKKMKNINDIDEDDDDVNDEMNNQYLCTYSYFNTKMHINELHILDKEDVEMIINETNELNNDKSSSSSSSLSSSLIQNETVGNSDLNNWKTMNDNLNLWRPRRDTSSNTSNTLTMRLPSNLLQKIEEKLIEYDFKMQENHFSEAYSLMCDVSKIIEKEQVLTSSLSSNSNESIIKANEKLEQLEIEIYEGLKTWCFENEGTFAHLECSFIKAEKCFTKCIEILKSNNHKNDHNITQIKLENSQHMQNNDDDDDNDNDEIKIKKEHHAKEVIVWSQECFFILNQWKQMTLMRCYAKTALALTDGTELSKHKTDLAFQASLDIMDSFSYIEDNIFIQDKFDELLIESKCWSHTPNYQNGPKTNSMDNDKDDDDDAEKEEEERVDRLNQQKHMRIANSIKQTCLVLISNAVGVFLQRGQIRLINNELELALEDLTQGKKLLESLMNSSFYISLSSNKVSPEHQKKNVWEMASQTLKRLEAAVLGSLAVCLFKTDVTRNGLAGMLGGGMNYRMQSLLRTAEQKHPDQGELLLLHGDIMSQLGDFSSAQDKFKKAAQGCPSSCSSASSAFPDPRSTEDETNSNLPPPPPLASTSPLASTALPAGCPLPYVNAGRAYLAMNEPLLAEKHLMRALEIDPTCASCYLDLGQLRLQGGDLPAAVRHFKEARRCSRSFPEFHDAMACEFVATAHQKAVDELLLC